MKGYVQNIEEQTLANNSFRKVVYTAPYMQLVLMSLQPGEEIGLEVHGNDQFFRFEQGTGKVLIDNNEYDVEDDFGVVVPSGAQHNVINTSNTEALKLYTIYAVPHHQDGIEFATKAEAEASNEEFDGKTSE